MNIRSPASRKRSSFCTLAPVFWATMVSVISTSIPAAYPGLDPSAPSTVATKLGWRSCTFETFTATRGTSSPSDLQRSTAPDIGARLFEPPAPHRDDEARFLEQRHEVQRRYQAELGVVPADQR